MTRGNFGRNALNLTPTPPPPPSQDRLDCQLLMGAFSYIYTHHLLKIGGSGVVGVAHHFSAITSSLRSEDVAQLVSQLQVFLKNDVENHQLL